jgi:uncharacterized surface protein with fasciclin (FAS1) repeats
MKRSLRNIGLAGLAASVLFVATGCGSDDGASTTTATETAPYTSTFDGAADKTVVADLAAAGDFTVLTRLLKSAGLVKTLSGPGPFTVFAPTDQAFEARAADLGVPLEDMLQGLIDNPALLTDLLRYHVVPGDLPAADVAALDGKRVETLSGEKWTVLVDGENVSIKDGFGQDVNVIDVDVAASNGVIHVVDNVLDGALPSRNGDDAASTTTTTKATPYTSSFDGAADKTVVADLAAAGNFTVLIRLLKAAGLVKTLSGPGPFTVFAPTDQAFEAEAADLGVPLEDVLQALIANPALLTDILRYHVVPGDLPAADLVALNGKKVETLSGEKWTVLADGENVSVKDGFGHDVNVIDVDVAASNGVIHVVDRVLDGAIPESK